MLLLLYQEKVLSTPSHCRIQPKQQPDEGTDPSPWRWRNANAAVDDGGIA